MGPFYALTSTIRADSGSFHLRLMRGCDSHGIGYVLALARNPVLERTARDERKRAERRFEQTGQPQRLPGLVAYAASTLEPASEGKASEPGRKKSRRKSLPRK